MKTITALLSTGLISALFVSPVFAGKSDDNGKRGHYKEHYMQRHQMNMDMMKMLSETMSILRDLNHKPSAEEKARLSDMISQINEMAVKHKEMGDKAMKHMDMKNKGKRMMDAEDNNDHRGKGKHHERM